VADQEGGFGGGEGAGGDDEVAFVFAGFRVEDDEGVAAGCWRRVSVSFFLGLRVGEMGRRTEGFDCFGDGVEGGLLGC